MTKVQEFVNKALERFNGNNELEMKFHLSWENARQYLMAKYTLPPFQLRPDGFNKGKVSYTAILASVLSINWVEGAVATWAKYDEQDQHTLITNVFEFLNERFLEKMQQINI